MAGETAIGIALLVVSILGGAYVVTQVYRRRKPSRLVREANRQALEKQKQREKLLGKKG